MNTETMREVTRNGTWQLLAAGSFRLEKSGRSTAPQPSVTRTNQYGKKPDRAFFKLSGKNIQKINGQTCISINGLGSVPALQPRQ